MKRLLILAFAIIVIITLYASIFRIPDATGETENLFRTYAITPEEKISPHNWIKPAQIQILEDKVIIELDDAYISGFTDTNSMDPVIDEGSHAIQVHPENESDIHVGDIISYHTIFSKNRIIHRVTEIGHDEDGYYVLTKGDNMAREDLEKVRFHQIERVLVAIIY